MKDKTAISSLMQNPTPNLLIKLQLGLIGIKNSMLNLNMEPSQIGIR